MVGKLDVKVELSGGIRDDESLAAALKAAGAALALVLLLGLGGAYALDRMRESRKLRAPDTVAELTRSPDDLDPPTLRMARARDKAILTVRGDAFSGTLNDDSTNETV